MSVGPVSSLRRTLIGRREQLRFRLIMGALIGGCFGQLLGWVNIAVWLAVYGILQVAEVACFFGERARFARWTGRARRWRLA